MTRVTGCSAERRALFGLAAASVSGRVPPGLDTALAECDPLALAKGAQRMQVHTLIGPVLTCHSGLAALLPDDLVLFFRAMHAANRQRLADGLAQLELIGSALNAHDIPAVVLKGGGDMLSPVLADPAARYVGDLDILVPMIRAGDAVAILRELGAAPAVPPAQEFSRYDWRGQRIPRHHLPRLIHAEWTFPVEIHVNAGAGAVARVLDAAAILDRRVQTTIRGLSIACADDRACHLLTHSTRHDGMVSLRAWIDWSMLRRSCDRSTVESRLCRAGYGQTTESCDAMSDLLMAGEMLPLSQNETLVARNASRAFGAAGAKAIPELARFLFRRCRGLALSSGYRRHIADRLAEPGFLRSVIMARLDRHGRER